MQLATNIIRANLPLDFIAGIAQAAFQATNPKTGRAHGTGQLFGAYHHQGNYHAHQKFSKTYVKHGLYLGVVLINFFSRLRC